jgi:squalene-associated FAD-dependent desaturase
VPQVPAPRVGIVGGGLAGLAAAVELCEQGCRVDLFEARRELGGRATSLRDPESDEWFDNCQHVALGCCEQFLQFLERTDTAILWRRFDTLHFFAADGRQYDLRGTRWLPAPLHLAPAFLRLGYLTWKDRWQIASALLKLARYRPTRAAAAADRSEPVLLEWLHKQHQSASAIDGFWAVVMVSALSETLDRITLSAARKVFVDGFFGRSDGYHVYAPRGPLRTFFSAVAEWLSARQVVLYRGVKVQRVVVTGTDVTGLALADGTLQPYDYVILAVPWRQVPPLLDSSLAAQVPSLLASAELQSAPITSLHLWFDRRLSDLPHAVFVNRLSQWVFASPEQVGIGDAQAPFYYQVVISASRQLRGRQRESVLEEVLADLRAIWPATAQAQLQRWRMVTAQEAVFSPLPGSDRLRPDPVTAIPHLLVAGDWTSTGWPATMESAVRSGFAAARALRQEFVGKEMKNRPAKPLTGWHDIFAMNEKHSEKDS